MQNYAAVDASQLPLDAYGSRGTMWWGLMGLIIIEAAFFALLIVSYFYYRIRYVDWPPASLPDLGLPLLNLILIVATCFPLWLVQRGAPDKNPRWLAVVLAVSTIFLVVTTVLRMFEFPALHTRYEHHSYGSITWAMLFAHGLEQLLTAGETGLLAYFAATNDLDVKHRSDIQLNSLFYYFLTITWVVIFAAIHIGARAL